MNRSIFRRPDLLFRRIAWLGVTLALGVWIPALLIHRGLLTAFGPIKVYPALPHSLQAISIFAFPAALGLAWSITTRATGKHLFTEKGIWALLAGIFLLFPLSYLDNHTIHDLILASLFFFTSMGLYSVYQSSPQFRSATLVLFVAFLAGGVGVLLQGISGVAKRSWMFDSGRWLVEFGFLPWLMFGFTLFPAVRFWIPGLQVKEGESHKPAKLILLISIYFALFLVEGLLLFLRSNPPLLLIFSLRIAILLFVLYSSFFGARPGVKDAWSLVYLLSWLLALMGIFGFAFSMNFGVHWAHLLFVGGFATQILLIFLKIQGEVDGMPVGSRWIYTFAALALVSAVTRSTAHLMKPLFASHLTYSAVTLMAAIGVVIYLVERKKRVY